MDKQWIEIAGLGTARKQPNPSAQESQVDAVREKLAKGQTELRILAGAGLERVQTMAAYLPPVDRVNLPMPDEKRPRLEFKEANLRHLALMHEGYFAPVYLEWLHWAALAKTHLPSEAIPLVLDLASQFQGGRELAKRMVGSRGRWMLRQAGNSAWQWLHHVEVGKTPRVGKYKKQEERVIGLFKPATYYHLGANVREAIRLLQHPWSLRFSEALLETVKGAIRQSVFFNGTDRIDIIKLSQFHIHPQIREAMLECFEDFAKDPEVPKAAENMGRLLAFRMDVREGFGIVD
jgi:hypothetical protein